MHDLAIKVDNVSKTFRIPHEKITTIRGAFVSALKSHGYEEFKALDDVSFEVKKGEFFGIIGRNGSGKSTLLKIIAGIYQPDKGKIKTDGLISPFLELGIGFNPELSGRDNVYLNAAVLGLTHKQIDEKFDDIVEFSELRRFIDQKVKNYSSGMQVRLMFSTAIHANREILLMDEVLAVGDTNFQNKCIEKFNEYRDQGKTVVLVTHDIGTVQRYCDRAMLLQDGALRSIGNSEKVANDYINLNQRDENKRLKEENEETKKEHKIVKNESKSINASATFRSGTKRAEIVSYKIINNNDEETLSLKTGEKFKIILIVDFHEDVDKTNFGFIFKDQRPGGIHYGIHSYYSKIPLILEDVKKGSKMEISCAGEMLLVPGIYTLSISCARQKSYPHYEDMDLMNNMIKINVYGDRLYWGSINSDGVVTAKYLSK
jgi:ABC-2 type transport system ATP-binding protein